MTIRHTRRQVMILLAMTGSLSLAYADRTIVTVVLPTIQSSLGLSSNSAHWIVTSYALAIASFVALGGRLGDVFGHVRLFRIGVVTFAVASAATAAAPDGMSIILTRFAQGVGVAFVLPSSAALVADSFADTERGWAMARYLGVASAFLSLGPLLGGLVADVFGWRAVFLINLPLAAGTLLLVRSVRVKTRRQAGTIDLGGAVTFAAGMALLVVACAQGTDWGWTSARTVALGLGAMAFTSAFVVCELRSDAPLLDLRRFVRRAPLVGGATGLFCLQFALLGTTVFVSIYLQRVRGYTALQTGLVLLIATVPIVLAAPLAGRTTDRKGPRRAALLGLGALVVALTWLAAVLTESPLPILVPGLVLIGVGVIFTTTSSETAGLSSVPSPIRGEASAFLTVASQIGASLGVAVQNSVLRAVASTPTRFADGVVATLVVGAIVATIGLIVIAALLGSLPVPHPAKDHDRARPDAR